MKARSEPGRKRSHCFSFAVFGALLVLACTAGTVWAAWGATTGNSNNELKAAPDWVAPTASRSVIQKAEGGTPGYVRQGGGYRILAEVSDSGNPASGVASVTALSGFTPNTALVPGGFSAGGLSYNQRSAQATLASPLSAGTRAYSLSLGDTAGNTRSQTGFSVIVDNTAPVPTDTQTTNRTGGTLGRAEPGDLVTYSFGELIDPYSLVGTWDGTGTTNVVVRINNNVAAFGGNDTLVVYDAANSTPLPLGTVSLARNDYVTVNSSFGAAGTASTMAVTGTSFQITLGTLTGTAQTVGSNSRLVWSPSAGATDRAGNPSSTASVTESGTNDRNF